MHELSAAQQKYLHIQKRLRRVVCVSRILILFGFLFVWEFTANTGIIDSFIFSCPSRIVLCFRELMVDGIIFHHIGITLYETIVSFLLVILISILMAVLLWTFRYLSEILDPYMVVLNSLPKSALAPLLIVWLGASMRTIIVAGMSVAIFGSIISMYTAFCETDPEAMKLIYTLGGNRLQVMTHVVCPSSLPSVISILKVNIGLCLVGVIIGEFLAAREGLGYLIIYSSQVFRLDYLIAALIILCVIAFCLYQLIQKLEHQIRKSRLS